MAAKGRRSIADMIPDDLTPEVPEGYEKPAPVPRPEPVAELGVPDPYESTASGPLDERERDHLAACETALDVLRIAFARAGKALQVVRDGRLYRDTHATFEAYCEERWEIQRAHADRLIRAWPIAEALDPIGSKVANEGQVRELVPLASRFGRDAAVTVYATLIRETRDQRVTAALVRGAVAALPDGPWDADQAAKAVREYLESLAHPEQDEAPAEDPAAVWERLRATVRRQVSTPTFRAAARIDPAQARTVVTELQAELGALLQDL